MSPAASRIPQSITPAGTLCNSSGILTKSPSGRASCSFRNCRVNFNAHCNSGCPLSRNLARHMISYKTDFCLDEPMDYQESEEETEAADDNTTSETALTEGVRLLDDNGEGEERCKETPPIPRSAFSATIKSKTVMSAGSSTYQESMPDTTKFPPIYTTVQKKKLGSLVVRNLDGCATTPATVCHRNGGAVSAPPIIGSFKNPEDRRHDYTNHRHDFENNRKISTSFDLKTLICNTCKHGEHVVLHRTLEGTDSGNQIPPCFVLSDQNFPPMLPVEGDGECIKIIQVENGTLDDLTGVLLGVTVGFAVPAGTVVVICSASYMAAVGAVVYAEDLVRAYSTLLGAIGGGGGSVSYTVFPTH
jgi:hypothetical protein